MKTRSLLTLCLFSPPIFLRCSNFICNFYSDSLLCSKRAWYLHKHKPAFKVNRKEGSGTTCWLCVGSGRGAWVQADLQYETRTWRSRVGLNGGYERNNTLGCGCFLPSSRIDPGKPQASTWRNLNLTWSLPQVNGKKEKKAGTLHNQGRPRIRTTKHNTQPSFGFSLNKSIVKRY